MMSTIGVTLISELKPLASLPAPIDITESPFEPPTTRLPIALVGRYGPTSFTFDRPLGFQLLRTVLDKVINQLRSRVIHFNNEAIDFAREVVE